MKNPTIKLLASIVLLIVFLHGRRGAAFSQQQPQSRIRVTIPGIPGNGLGSTIDAYGYSGGILAAVGPSTTPTFQDFSFTKGIDQATPVLALKVALGNRLPSVKVDVYSVDPNTQMETLYLEITMTNVRVTGSTVTVDTSKSLSSAVEQVTLCYSGITYSYRFPPPTGRQDFQYDRAVAC